MEILPNSVSNEYDLYKDWKFISVVQFVNVFKNVLAVDAISTYELEFSLKNPDIEPLCLNILLKLLMKKALFKPNSKIGENFELSKLNDLLLKKINFFYKTYIRYLKKLHGVVDNSKIIEIIKKDTEDYKSKIDPYSLTSTNLADRYYEDLDLKNMMIVEFFRILGGINPLLKISMQNGEKLDMFLNQDEKDDENIVNMAIDKEKDKLSPLRGETNTNTNITPSQNVQIAISEDYLTFIELSLKEKVEILFFFCNYAITFSGRSSFFKEELTKGLKDATNGVAVSNYKRIKPLGKDSEQNIYYSFLCNKDSRIYKEDINQGIEIHVRNFAELEKFISKLENEASPSSQILLNKINDNLLMYKEFDEEEKKKEQVFLRKQQAFEKAKKLSKAGGTGEVERYANSDFFLMNISDHVITRNQLNQITKVNMSLHSNYPQSKPQPLTEDEKRKIKIEKEKLERQRRMEKRTKLIEKLKYQEECEKSEESGNLLNNKRTRKSQGHWRKSRKKRRIIDSSEDEYISMSDSYSNSSESELNLESESVEEEEKNNIDIEPLGELNNEEKSTDIIIEGFLIYRYSNNQIELDGNWYVTADPGVKERVSYLFTNSNEITDFYLSKNDIIMEPDSSGKNSSLPMKYTTSTDYKIKICSANLFECITISKLPLFEACLKYLSGEYGGYFMYFGKTIEDRINLTFCLQESLVRVVGEGTNSLGAFSVLGYMNFYRTKDSITEKNKLDCEYIKLAEFKLTKIYTEFNPNENYRVIKSYQHRRKKNEISGNEDGEEFN